MNFNKPEALIAQYHMLPPGSRVLCAVSGGADSVCLLHLLLSRPGISVACAHFNHRLRGEESERDEAFVRKLCRELAVECHVGSGDVAAYAAAQGLGIEDAARRLRYAFLEETAAACGADRIATAHNAGDNAETLLLNLTRGAGLKGLGGIPPVRGKIVRPLLHTTREEILAYLREQGLPYVEDSSNASDAFARNRLRHHVLPVLREQNPEAEMAMARTAQLLREDEDYLSGLAACFLEERREEDNSLPVPELREMPRPVRLRVFRLLCGPSLSLSHAQALERLCLGDAPHAAADVPGMRVRREFDRLLFGAREAEALPVREVLCGQKTLIPERQMEISCTFIENCLEIHNSFNTFCFQSENIYGKISVASRREGARVELAGRKCGKSLKKLFSEAGMPLAERLTTPVFYDERGVIAVYGFGVAERCAAHAGDNVIKIEVMCKDGKG